LNQFELLQKALPSLQMIESEPMKNHTTFKVGGPCAVMLLPKNTEELRAAIGFLRETNTPYAVIGKGSNLLVADKGTDLVIIKLAENFSSIQKIAPCRLEADAGVSLAKLAAFAAESNLSGLAFAAGIPGTVGGGVFMNAGAYGGELSTVIERVTVLTPAGDLTEFTNEQCTLGYRESFFSKNPSYTIVRAAFALTPGKKEEIHAEMADLAKKRREKQPLEYPSAGSTFKRPEGAFAGTLIEAAGLKGLKIGGAQVSEKHAGFVINTGGATAADIRALISRVQNKVKAQSGFTLECEVRFLD